MTRTITNARPEELSAFLAENGYHMLCIETPNLGSTRLLPTGGSVTPSWVPDMKGPTLIAPPIGRENTQARFWYQREVVRRITRLFDDVKNQMLGNTANFNSLQWQQCFGEKLEASTEVAFLKKLGERVQEHKQHMAEIKVEYDAHPDSIREKESAEHQKRFEQEIQSRELTRQSKLSAVTI